MSEKYVGQIICFISKENLPSFKHICVTWPAKECEMFQVDLHALSILSS